MEILKLFLLPFSLLYEGVTRLRNLFFDLKILTSATFNLPIIVVGNLSAGGTGKTPHVEYLIRLLFLSENIATLSRGYGRTTKGFRMAGPQEDSGSIGDEPSQLYSKFKNIIVAVDENRRNGIKRLLEVAPKTDVIILDDAYQHRYVKPGLSILLTDYHKPFTQDYMLPYGTLREVKKGAKRANIIVVTKTPSVLSPFERQRLIKEISPSPFQKVLFSFVKYGEMKSLWSPEDKPDGSHKYSVILMVAGIANPYPLEFELRNKCSDLIIMRFNDHHKYSATDIKQIKENYSDIYTRNKLLVTTEKDAMRLLHPEIREQASQLPFHYLPMEIDFHNGDKQVFDETIKKYVRENKRER